MGGYDYLKSYERQIEAIVVAITSIYCITELFLGYKNQWNALGQLAVLVGLLCTGIFFFGRYKTYEVRAHVSCFTSQIMVLVYGIECGDFYLILSMFISLCILLGLYGVTQAMWYPFVSYNLLVLYYIFIAKQLTWGQYSSDVGMITRVLQGYLTLFLVIYLVYRYKSSHESMVEMIDALRKSERQKDDFLANVSHEIRTPINTICGISEIMLQNEVPEELREDMRTIQSAGRNLMSVVGDILDYSELQEGEFEILEENYYMSSMIEDVINMSLAKKSEKNIDFSVDCDADMPSVLIGDEQKIRRVVMNIVNNAIEFTEEGYVKIQFGHRKEEYGINLIISVKDSGIGMSQESIEKLFKKFSQADMGRTRKKGGVGLGLAIAQTIINRMGGFITVKSELEKGSEFKIIIPQKVYDMTPVEPLSKRKEINTEAHVLVIDDNRMNIKVVEGLLRTYGIKVSYALSGQEGLDMLSSKAYDLVLMDHMMPGMDGIETFHHIRKKPEDYFKKLPVIALTANAIAGAREMFIKEGFSDFIAKPVESSVLQRTLKRHLKEIPKSMDVSEAKTQELHIGDLDISKGIMYCGNQENYLEILSSQRDSGKTTMEQVQQLYEKEDWKNYIIAVHGIKSSMMSIGAVKLSEMAKALEFAGKDENFEFIQTEHAKMLTEFERVMQILQDCEYLTRSEDMMDTVEKPELVDEEFSLKLVELENATYELDANKVFPILDELSKFSYHSKDLAQELKPVYKKVEMYDFMSAYETVVRMKDMR